MCKKFICSFLFFWVVGCLCILNTPALAVTTLTANDAIGTSSFNAAGNWNDGLAPYAGNTYSTVGYLLRTPTVAGNYTFAGDSLTVGGGDGGGANPFRTDGGVNNNALINKTPTGTRITANNLILDAGHIRDGMGSNDVWTIAGNITVTSNGGGLVCQCRFNIDSVISGSGTLYVGDNGSGEALRTIYINSGLNTYNGNIQLTALSGEPATRCRLTFSDNSRMNFVIGASGVNNSISGTGTATFEGDFSFDLTGAGTTLGNSWTIVSASSQTYSSTFTVLGFTDIDGTLWMKSANGVTYQFSESTGILSVVPPMTKAYHPTPVNGATVTSTSTTLTWYPGAYADKHDIYIGTDLNAVTNATEASHPGVTFIYRQDPNSLFVTNLTPATTHYWRVDEVNSAPDYTIFQGDIWNFNVRPVKATNPNPANGAVFVDPNANLSWIAGSEAAQHKVYFGTTHPLPPVATQTATTYEPNKMAFGTIYYWRIDEVNGPQTWQGDEWQFTTRGAYVDANGSATGNTVNATTGSPTDWWVTGVIQDNLWDYRAGMANNPEFIMAAPNNNIYQASGTAGAEDCPTIMTTISGLIPGEKYDVSVVYESAAGAQNWFICAGFDLNNMLFFDRLGQDGAAAGTPTGKTEGDRTEYAGLIGRIQADINGRIKVYIDDKPAISYIDRTWYDGLLVGPAALTASNPSPRNGAINVELGVQLSWEPGAKAASHKVYLDPNIANVQARKGCDVNGVSTIDPSYNPGSLESFTTYYWAIDEVNGAEIWPGIVWRFTIRDYSIIDDFESYIDTGFTRSAGTLRNTWIDGYYQVTFPSTLPLGPTDGKSGSFVQLVSDSNDGTTNPASPVLAGDESMKFYYDNDGTITWLSELYNFDPVLYTYVAPTFSEAMAAIVDAGRLSTNHESRRLILNNFSSYKLLRVPYYGDPTNTVVASDKLYVTLQDADGTSVTITNPDQTILQMAGWHNWYIKMSSFAAFPALDLTNITRIYIGIGNKSSPVSGGRGAIFLDEIKLLAEGVCLPGNVVGDLDNDCIVNETDLQILVDPNWAGQKSTLPAPIINLNASTGFLAGPPLRWQNTGTGGGYFYDANTADPNNPDVATIEGKTAVVFDDTDLLIWKTNDGSALITAPATLTSDHNEPNDFTVIYEVWNLEVADQEHILTWARRGGPVGTHAGFCYGTNNQFGAVIHWEWTDMGFDVYDPPAHTWHTIGVTYDGKTEVVAVDGIIQSVEDKNIAVRANEMVTLGAGYLVSTNPNDNWVGGYGYVDSGLFGMRYSGALASIKVYGSAIKPADLVLQTGNKANLYLDNKIDFKDIAVLATKWLVGPVLFQ